MSEIIFRGGVRVDPNRSSFYGRCPRCGSEDRACTDVWEQFVFTVAAEYTCADCYLIYTEHKANPCEHVFVEATRRYDDSKYARCEKCEVGCSTELGEEWNATHQSR